MLCHKTKRPPPFEVSREGGSVNLTGAMAEASPQRPGIVPVRRCVDSIPLTCAGQVKGHTRQLCRSRVQRPCPQSSSASLPDGRDITPHTAFVLTS